MNEKLGMPERTDYDGDPSVGEALINETERREMEMNTLRKENEQLKHDAFTDPLTELPNRRAFGPQLNQMIDRLRAERETNEKRIISILTFDIDRFKSVNDTFGHPEGDRILKTFGALLKGHVRSNDLIARLGGEEFAIAFEGEKGNGYERAEEIRRAVESIIRLPDGRPVTVSIGISETTGYRGKKKLEERADEALYRAKEEGRNRTVVAGQFRDESSDEVRIAA